MGSLPHGHHSPSYDLECCVGRTGLPAHTHLQGAGGDKTPRVPIPKGPKQALTWPCWEKKNPLPQGDPPACQQHGSDPCLTPALTFSSRSCQLSHVTSTGLCLWGHLSASLLVPQSPEQQMGWDGPGHRSRARSAANDARSMAVSPMGPEWPPETSPSPSSTCHHTLAVMCSGRIGKGVSLLEPQSGSLGSPCASTPNLRDRVQGCSSPSPASSFLWDNCHNKSTWGPFSLPSAPVRKSLVGLTRIPGIRGCSP